MHHLRPPAPPLVVRPVRARQALRLALACLLLPLSLAFTTVGGFTGPALLFLLIPLVLLLDLLRSVGLALTLSEDGIAQRGALGVWSLGWADVASWEILSSRASYRIVLHADDGRALRLSDWVSQGNARQITDRIRARCGPPARGCGAMVVFRARSLAPRRLHSR